MDDIAAYWDEPKGEVDRIAGDRRRDRRYELRLDMRWKLLRRRRVLDQGAGRTLDLSSSGILFESGRELPTGFTVELSVTWPVLLHNVAPLQLVAAGRIVRTDGGRAAIRMAQHEFRTMAISGDQRRTPVAAAMKLNGDPTRFFAGGMGKPQ
ncbi:MAG: PilZ domain-containing protein [Bryobacteraceae bacterium]|jgi:hypothetical protein